MSATDFTRTPFTDNKSTLSEPADHEQLASVKQFILEGKLLVDKYWATNSADSIKDDTDEWTAKVQKYLDEHDPAYGDQFQTARRPPTDGWVPGANLKGLALTNSTQARLDVLRDKLKDLVHQK